MRVFDGLVASVAAVASAADLSGSVVSSGSFGGDMPGAIVSDDSLDTIVQPGGGVTQCVAMEVWVGGSKVASSDLLGSITVERDYDNIVQGWSFTTPLTDPDGVFGDPFTCIGPAIGLDTVEICGVYSTPSGEVRVPLITDGIVDNSHREASESGITETFSGVDRGGRFDGVKVTKQFPPGHGLPRGRVGRVLMNEAGETQIDFRDGARMDKEIQIVDAEPLQTLAEIFEVENRKLLWSSDGYVTNPQVGVSENGDVLSFSFDETDFLRMATVSMDSQGSVITKVVANGTQQLVKDQGPCETRTESIVEESYQDNYTILRSLYRQTADLVGVPGATHGEEYHVEDYDSLTPNFPSPGSTLVSRKEITRKYICDVLVEEIILTYGYARRETARHEWAYYTPFTGPDVGYWKPLSCYTDDDGGAGSGPAYADQDESFRLVEASLMRNYYLYDGFVNELGALPLWGPFLVIQDIRVGDTSWLYASQGGAGAELLGQAQGTVTWYARLGHIKTSIKEEFSSPPEPWFEIEPSYFTKIWGDGSGAGDGVNPMTDSASHAGFISPVPIDSPKAYDTMIPWTISVTGLHGTADQFVDRQAFAEIGWGVNKGGRYYFQEGDIRSGSSEEFVVLNSTVTSYSTNKTTHTEEAVFTDGLSGTKYTNTKTGLPGGLPAIERLDFVEPATDIYEAGEATETDPITGEIIPGLDKQAKRGETKQFSVTVPFDFFLTCHTEREVVVEFPWAETEDELRAMAEALSQESASMLVVFTVAANFLIREAQVIHVTYRPLGIDHDVRVKSVRWESSPGSPILTMVTCKLYAY